MSVQDKSVGLWLVREEALPLAVTVGSHLDVTIYHPWLEPERSQRDFFKQCFKLHSAWILVMTTGIAVRFLDGLLVDKKTDPAVVVIDEAASFAVSLSGGHEGGANLLAAKVSRFLCSVPVITTATEALKPFTIGIGTRKGVSLSAVKEAIESALATPSFELIKELATIDLKAEEPAIKEFCELENIPLRVFSKEAVAGRLWNSKPSSWVKKSIGLEGVCEPCALMANPRGLLKQKKRSLNGVAVAVVEDVRCQNLLTVS